ncbi:unnamed protein product [Microthlaspi erraticum]|uniref:DM2 domain-containing protein n=1 Tax=Microthlaspi erraticum TaxID=1685480 RepID=A0A6D2KTQ9_9BRAS|nr:unnamed protein product [Microthlaspi erraticum]
MAIKAGKVLRTATAAAKKFHLKQFTAAQSASLTMPPSLETPAVIPSSGVGTFLGIPNLPRSNTDILISKYIKLYQNRLTKKGEFSEKNLSKILTGDIGINETTKLLDGCKTFGESSAVSTNVRSLVKSRKKK